MKSAEKVDFKKIVVKEAKKILSEIDEVPLPLKLLSECKEQYEQKM